MQFSTAVLALYNSENWRCSSSFVKEMGMRRASTSSQCPIGLQVRQRTSVPGGFSQGIALPRHSKRSGDACRLDKSSLAFWALLMTKVSSPESRMGQAAHVWRYQVALEEGYRGGVWRRAGLAGWGNPCICLLAHAGGCSPR